MPAILPAQAFGDLGINRVLARFHAHGIIGSTNAMATPLFEVPQGGGVHALYAAGLWVGGVSSMNQLHLAAQQYETLVDGDFWPGPLGTNAGISPSVSMQYDRVWIIRRSEILQHRAYFDCLADPGCDVAVEFPGGLVIPPDLLSWPAMGDVTLGQDTYLAPFVDRDGNGSYDPAQGDHPCVPGDMALYFIFNDQRPHQLTGSLPIGLEIHGLAYAFDAADGALAHTVFVNYRLINRSTLTLSDARLGLFADFDLGDPMDDRVGTDVERNMVYVYNADDVDDDHLGGPGYGLRPPAFGLVQLRGTLVDPNGLDDAMDDLLPAFNGSGFGDGVMDNERFGLTVTRASSNAFGPLGGPVTAPQYHAHLRGLWNDNSPQYYGGIGHVSDPATDISTVARFCYPDASDPVGAGTNGVPQAPWSEVTTNAPGGDRRILASQGPFTWEPGMTRQLHLAFTWARAGSGGPWASVQALQARADSVQAFFLDSLASDVFEAQAWCPMDFPQAMASRPRSQANMVVYPVPARDQLTVRVDGMNVNATMIVVDAMGRRLLEQQAGVDGRLDISSLSPGSYVLTTDIGTGPCHARFIVE